MNMISKQSTDIIENSIITQKVLFNNANTWDGKKYIMCIIMENI